MSDFEDKLNNILSSPETMAQVAALAQQLTGGGEPASAPPPPPPAGDSPGAPDLGNLLGGLDPSMVGRLLPLLQEWNSPLNDQRAALLHALRPFLKPERQEKVDQALRVAHLIHMGKKFLGQLGG